MAKKESKNKKGESFSHPKKEDFTETFQWRMFRIMAEFVEGFQFISDFSRPVAFFGSARFKEDNEYYKEARELAKKLAEDDYSIVTGGGPGIMEAANRGALDGDGKSIGISIELSDQNVNEYVKERIDFHYFFVRKVMLSFASYGYIFFPGGFGTLDEFFEMITLIQTKAIEEPITVVAVGKDYWGPLLKWMEDNLVEKFGTINKEDLEIFQVVDSADKAHEIINKSPGPEF